MNEKDMNDLTAPLLAAIDAVRDALAIADIPAMNLRFEANGRTDGDLLVQFKLCQQYDDDTVGSSLAAVVNEYLRRRGWNQRHAPLCLPNACSEENCPGHVASEHDPKVCGLCGTHIDSLRPDVQADDEIPF